MTLVARRFSQPEWAFLRQVRNKTGGTGGVERYADGLALNCYPSRGMELHGFEAKSSRSDWVRELSNPDKSCAIQVYCNRWWIVVDNATIVRVGELPPTWGLMVADERGTLLDVVTEAPKLPDPKPLDRKFVASMLRSVAKTETSSLLIEAAKEEERDYAREAAERRLEAEKKRIEEMNKELRVAIEEFETVSGLRINRWDAGRIGKAVALLMLLQGNPLRNQLQRQLDVVQRLEGAIKDALVELGTAELVDRGDGDDSANRREVQYCESIHGNESTGS